MHVMTDTNISTKNSLPHPHNVAACTCFNLRKAARVVSQAYDNVLKPVGLKATQFSVLATLDTAGPLPMTQLAEQLLIDRTALSRNLKPLERDGLVLLAGEADQRVRLVTLTPEGKRNFDEALPLWEAIQTDMVDALGRDDWARLLGGLGAAVDAVQTG
jgi:DNA-binding MarR family transcriptional regulator